MKRRLRIIAVLAAMYFLSYLVFRFTHIELWEKNGKRYVIFPKEHTWIYYLYRPLTYVDSKVTTMGFHIGPHVDD